ncbi:MAG: hypothetical protein R2879_15615 [Saprospiraceae bacterium]
MKITIKTLHFFKHGKHFLLFFCLVSSVLFSRLVAQEQFNKRIEFSSWASLIANIYSVDTAIYVVGTRLESGNIDDKRLFISKINLNGQVEYSNDISLPKELVVVYIEH